MYQRSYEVGDRVRMKTASELKQNHRLNKHLVDWENDMPPSIVDHFGKYFTVEEITSAGNVRFVESDYTWTTDWIAEPYEVKLDEDLFTL